MNKITYFKDIDRKLKISSIVVLVFGIILSLIFAIILFINAGQTNEIVSYFSSKSGNGVSVVFIVLGLVVLVGGSIISVITSFLIYGFAVIIENTNALNNANHFSTEVQTNEDNNSLQKVISHKELCKVCGSKLRKGAKFCSVCGEKIESEEDNNVLS